MSKSKKLLLLLFLIILMTTISFIIIHYVGIKVEHLQKKQYIEETQNLHKQLTTLIEAKKKSTMAIAIALSNDAKIRDTITKKSTASNLNLYFQELSAKLRKNSDYKNVWLQLIDKHGINIACSWSPEHTDTPLAKIRDDLQEMIQHPRMMNSISVGKFAMTFKSMVPLFDEKREFLGSIETITHFNSIIKKLETLNISSIVLADKKYKNSLTKPISKNFIDDYYVANFHADPYTLKLLKEIGIEKVLHTKEYLIYKNNFITPYVIKNIRNEEIGYYIFIKSLRYFDHRDIDKFIHYVRNVTLVVIFISLLITVFFYKRKKDIEKQRTYFKEIIDSTSDIIIITDSDRPLDVNKAFFKLFDEFKTLAEFEDKYGCVCNLFEKGEGFLEKEMGNKSWVEYAYANNHQEHIVKMILKERAYYFSIHINKLNESQSSLYTLVLTDITKLKKYQYKLEYISRTDTLTNIGNRESFQYHRDKEMAKSKRHQHPLSLIMLDIDHFKNINDSYGHDVGDTVLVEMSKAIQNILRKGDIFCRYGGEEFVILVAESPMDDVYLFAERIRTEIENLQLPFVKNITVPKS